MVRSGGIVVATGLIAAAAGASAETKTLARAGSWQAFGGTTIGGRGFCGISAEPAGRYFSLTVISGSQTFTIQISTNAWTLDDATKIPLTLRFDNNPIWRVTGTPFHFDGGDNGLLFDVRRAEIGTFVSEFRDSSALRIQFEDDRLPQWVMRLEGTLAVNSALRECMKSLQ